MEFETKKYIQQLLSLLGRMTQENLTYQIQYLKVENEILRTTTIYKKLIPLYQPR